MAADFWLVFVKLPEQYAYILQRFLMKLLKGKLLLISRTKKRDIGRIFTSELAAAFTYCVYDDSRGGCDEVAIFVPQY